jgi:hypothetical protein
VRNLRNRIGRAEKITPKKCGPLTVVLVDAPATKTAHRVAVSRSWRVLELVSNSGEVELPEEPFKLIRGTDPCSLV